MKRKWLVITGVMLIVALAGGLFAYREFTRKPKGAMETEAAYSLTPSDIAKSFMEDEQKANTMYVGKAIAITGIISEVKADENSNRTLVFFDSALQVTISASVDSIHNSAAAAIQSGDRVSVKCFCIGFTKDELLGSDIQLNRCGITQNQ